MRRHLVFLPGLLLMLVGCGYRLTQTAPNQGDGSPLARGINGGSASMTFIACAPSTERARLVEETLIQLNAQGVVAVADGPGTSSRVVLNLCGQGGPATQPRTTR
jgi:hypothetical protein